MRSSVVSLALLTLTAVSGLDTWGPSVSFGPAKSTIIYSSTIIQPPEAPVQPKGGFLTIWPGISNSTSDLVQSCLDKYQPGENCTGVPLEPGEWCALASVYGTARLGGLFQQDAPGAVVKKDQKIQIEYRLEPNNLNWTQWVSSALPIFGSRSTNSPPLGSSLMSLPRSSYLP